MSHLATFELTYLPLNQFVEAHLIELTPELAIQRVMSDWWSDHDLLETFDPPPIDREWDWRNPEIELDGEFLRSKVFALQTGDGLVQGAMLISTEPVDAVLEPGRALFIERIFTAPRNRPALRADNLKLYVGVGLQLLRWAVHLSRRLNCDGRVRLDGSPDFLKWYEARGLLRLDLEPIVFEGVEYMPMALPASRVDAILNFAGPSR